MTDQGSKPGGDAITPEQAWRECFRLDQRITNIKRWGDPEPGSINETVLAALIAKRDRLAPIAAQYDPVRCEIDRRAAPPILFKKFEWTPTGTLAIEDVIGDMPAFLRRRVT